MDEVSERVKFYPWVSDETLTVKDISIQLHCEIIDFVNYVEAKKRDNQIREEVVGQIKKIVGEIYPKANVMVFGSCATGLNLPNSDIDLVVYNPSVNEQDMIREVGNGLLREGVCKTFSQLRNAKVPIIKMSDIKYQINVDISFNRTNGIYCVKLVKILLKKYPELRPLSLVLKAYLKSRSLNEPYTGGVGSFLLTMMITSYL